MNPRTTQIVIAALIGLLLLGGGFAAGMTVGRGQTETAAKASPSGATGGSGAVRFGQGGAGGAGARGAGGQEVVAGRVISVNDGSITVEVRQPGAQGASPTTTSQIVLVGSNTQVVKTTESALKVTDLKANDIVQIVGAVDANGNLSATAIISGGNALQQLFGGGAGFGGPGGGRGASPSPSPTR
ncbi:MAG TPA: hypothetical protein VEU77_13010 [Candidatus Acidoferrales bacterium]|nr:hypothetical protein [Candidatus Acidoferrales bacterium]